MGCIKLQILDQQYKTELRVKHFKKELTLNNSVKNERKYLFSGHIKDEESGLYYVHARYYNPNDVIPYSTDAHWFNRPHLSPYVWCGNNPIMRIDPDGNDDYFNENGKFSHSTKTGTKIYVGDKLLTDVDLKSKENRQAVAKVVRHYADKVGLNRTTVGININTEKTSERNPAFTQNGKVYLNYNDYQLSSEMSDFNNVQNVLIHEKDHIDKGHNGCTNYEHAQVYFTQISDPSFAKTTKTFQRGTLNSMAEYLQNAANANYADEVSNLMNKTNGIINKLGFHIGVSGQPVMMNGIPNFTIECKTINKKK